MSLLSNIGNAVSNAFTNTKNAVVNYYKDSVAAVQEENKQKAAGNVTTYFAAAPTSSAVAAVETIGSSALTKQITSGNTLQKVGTAVKNFVVNNPKTSAGVVIAAPAIAQTGKEIYNNPTLIPKAYKSSADVQKDFVSTAFNPSVDNFTAFAKEHPVFTTAAAGAAVIGTGVATKNVITAASSAYAASKNKSAAEGIVSARDVVASNPIIGTNKYDVDIAESNLKAQKEIAELQLKSQKEQHDYNLKLAEIQAKSITESPPPAATTAVAASSSSKKKTTKKKTTKKKPAKKKTTKKKATKKKPAKKKTTKNKSTKKKTKR